MEETRHTTSTNAGVPPTRYTPSTPAFGRGRGIPQAAATPTRTPGFHNVSLAGSVTSSSSSNRLRQREMELERAKRQFAFEQEEAEAEVRKAAAEAEARRVEAESQARRRVHDAKQRLFELELQHLKEEEEDSDALSEDHESNEAPSKDGRASFKAEAKDDVQSWVDAMDQAHSQQGEMQQVPAVLEIVKIFAERDERAREAGERAEERAREEARLSREEARLDRDIQVKLLEVLAEKEKSAETRNKTSSKFLARQSTSKELPQFSGDPEDWPNFIAEYERSSALCEFSPVENISRLSKCLKGRAKDVVRSLLTVPENLDQALDALRMNFGRPDLIITTLVEKAEKIAIIREGQFDALMEFSNSVTNAVATMNSLKKPAYLQNPILLKQLALKLPPTYQASWAKERITKPDITLEDFSTWLHTEAVAVAHLVTPKPQVRDDRERRERRSTRVLAVSSSDQTVDTNPSWKNVKSTKQKSAKWPCPFCDAAHFPHQCEKAKNMQVKVRVEVVKHKNLCWNCLSPDHRARDCKSKYSCREKDCGKKHHTLLHQNKSTEPDPKEPVQLAAMFCPSTGDEVLLSIIQVKVAGPNGECTVYALLDTGAAGTFLDREVAKRIGVIGPRKPLRMMGVSSKPKWDQESQVVSMKIQGSDTNESFTLDGVRTVKDLNLPMQTVRASELKKKWSHLKDVPVQPMMSARPMLLIGQDHYNLLLTREFVEGDGGPIATRTKLGWVIQGKNTKWSSESKNVFAYTVSYEDYDTLHQLVKESFKTETFGVRLPAEPRKSAEDAKACEYMEKYSRQVKPEDRREVDADKWMLEPDILTSSLPTARWMTALPWRDSNCELPRSKHAAQKRLLGLEKKLGHDPKLAEEYMEKIQVYLQKGFIRKLEAAEAAIDGPHTWYLPHFPVWNPNKPGKWRLVFDAAAKVDDKSLNDFLLQGPDLLTPLPQILCKFRQKKFGFTADIKDFFPRVWVRPDDAVAQRFLWRGKDRDRPPDVYELSVLTFGAVCSPFCAQDARNRNAKRFLPDYPEAVDAIMHKHYVDDYLDCSDTVEEGVQLIQQVSHIHKKGGFQIVGWTGSSREMLAQLPDEVKISELKDLEPISTIPVARVLGLRWDPNADVFTFTGEFNKVSKDLTNGDKRPTKREMLKIVMSVFDPLGLLSHFTVKAKILLQEVWRTEIGWDDEVTTEIFEKWLKWIDDLKRVSEFRVPRCYSQLIPDADSVQLHIFSDASEKAFSIVAYFRVKAGSTVHTALVMGRTRVAPLKALSIPRLELQAAVMASRLSRTILETHTLKIERTIFWTDSMTVLRWIRADSRNYKPFVAHRIGEIQEVSDVADWRWVPTSENVADDATRDSAPTEFSPTGRWVNGPDFLRREEDVWPVEKPSDKMMVEDEEIKSDASCYIVHPARLADSLPDVTRYSSYLRLIRVTAWMFRFICRTAPEATLTWEERRSSLIQSLNSGLRRSSRLKATRTLSHQIQELVPGELHEAEKTWWKRSQWESFPEEMQYLSKDKPVAGSSPLAALSPYLEDGIIRVKGRLDKGKCIPESARRPVILDPKHLFTRLLIQHYHEKFGHHGRELVVNELRQKYWILNIRTAVKSAWNSCLVCRIRRSKAVAPEMGQLPAVRLEPTVRPFINAGVDYFGPMEVTIGRHHEKRYGVLFTCLAVRAVHLEIAASLTTDSAIMAIRRFVSRRGYPEHLYSDNGTNFRGADNELKEAVRGLDSAKIQATFASKNMEWHFIPPAAPHMGGAWERLVRSVKTALKATLYERAPKEEVLMTLFAEAENLVNSRPLTHVSNDADDPESLTPNHFLIGSSSNEARIGTFDDRDLSLRKQWRIAQRLTDHFWQRWLKEFLPTLTQRKKWRKKIKPIEVGDLVLIMEDDAPRGSWLRGKVIEVFPGKDGQVRVARVKTHTGILKRPAVKLCVLDLTDEVNDPGGH